MEDKYMVSVVFLLSSTRFPLSLRQDTVVIPMLHSVLKEEKQWATPWTFNPEHFLDEKGSFKKNPAFMPFSAGYPPAPQASVSHHRASSMSHVCFFLTSSGKRGCVGESLARMEIFLFVVSMLQRFTFSCSGGPDSVDLTPEYSSFANLPRNYDIIATPRC